MSSAKKNRRVTPKKKPLTKTAVNTVKLSPRLRECILIIGLAISCYLLAALVSYQHEGPHHFGGWLGSSIAYGLLVSCGLVAYFIPFALSFGSYLIFRTRVLLPSDDYSCLA